MPNMSTSKAVGLQGGHVRRKLLLNRFREALMAVLGSGLFKRAIGAGALVALTLLGLSAQANAQGDESGLDISFESISLSSSVEPTKQVTELITAGGSNRYVAFNADVLMDDLQAAENVNLELFNGVEFSLSTVDAADGVAGSRYWSASNDTIEAIFSELNGIIHARIADIENSTIYRIVGVNDGSIHLVVEDKVVYPRELETWNPPAPDTDGSQATESSTDDTADDAADNAASDVTANDGPQVDVLAWYDDDAIAFWGTSTNAEAAIAAAYNTANDAADRSGALVTFNLVELKSVSWTAPSSASVALFAIRDETDEILDQIHTARDAAGADLVAVIGDLIGGCGIAFVPEDPPSSGRADLGFSYTDAACVGGNLTLVHETAHNFGASHDIGASQPGPGLHSYSQGYVNPAVGYRTIMSYSTACSGCMRVPYFSNPTAMYNGNPTGDPGKDNARTLTESAAGVASYRSGGDTTDPDTTIAMPAQNAAINNDPVVLSGTASDDVGVTRARLTIYETGNYNTWNGSAFTPAFSTVDAALDSTGATLTSWSYDLTGAPDGQVVFTAVAYDAADNTDASNPWRLFTVANDSAAPDATIDSPASGATVSGEQILLEGIANDNEGISRVRMTIYNTNGYTTWDGDEEAFTTPFTTVDADLIPDGGFANWTYAMNDPSDAQVVFTALAYDIAGNTDPTKPWRLFTIDSNSDTVAPDAVIDNPTQGEVVSGLITLEGTATDNVGIIRVRMTIYNTSDNSTWDGEEFTATYSTVDAELIQSGTNADWSYDLPDPGVDTQIVFTALAFDSSNNTDPSRPWRLFETVAS